MIQECAFIILFLQINLLAVKTNEIPIYNLRHVDHIKPRSLLTSIERLSKQYCFFNNKWLECAAINNLYDTMYSITKKIIREKFLPHGSRPHNRIRELNSNINSHLSESQPVYRRLYMASPNGLMNIRPLSDLHGSVPAKPYPMYRPGLLNPLPRPDVKHNMNTAWNGTPLHPHTASGLSSPAQSTQVNSSSFVSHNRLKPPVTMTEAVSGVPQQMIEHKNLSSINKFTQSLDDFERQFYKNGSVPAKPYPMYRPGRLNTLPRPDVKHNMSTARNTLLHPLTASGLSSPAQSTQVNCSSFVSHNRLKPPVTMTKAVSGVPQQMIEHKNLSSINKFTQNLDDFERKLCKITFTKLTAISPVDRQENGMSFVQSGLFLVLTLMALWKEVDTETRTEIEQCIGFNVSEMDSVDLVRHFISTLPNSSDKLKLRQSSRLMLWPGREVSPRFQSGAAAALMLQVEWFNGTETSDTIATILNQKVEIDSGGAIHDTFDEDDVSGGVTAVLVSTLYVRGRWRAAPTVLNGTRPFRDADNAPNRTVRMIRINDVMNYADLMEWDAQALEISYATPGLTLLMLIPRGNSLKGLVQHVSNTSIGDITSKMKTMRVAATLPIYTLRMTLLLPNKLQALGIPRLVDISNVTETSSLRLSHAVQRIMFWAEAGRNAYKDDGIEWDQAPELEAVVDRPYIFFVRWRNVTLINGNFVL